MQNFILMFIISYFGTRWRSWGTALQAGRLRVRFPMVSLEFFTEFDSASNINEYQEYFLEGKGSRRVELSKISNLFYY
jgi:hypothetical protein